MSAVETGRATKGRAPQGRPGGDPPRGPSPRVLLPRAPRPSGAGVGAEEHRWHRPHAVPRRPGVVPEGSPAGKGGQGGGDSLYLSWFAGYTPGRRWRCGWGRRGLRLGGGGASASPPVPRPGPVAAALGARGGGASLRTLDPSRLSRALAPGSGEGPLTPGHDLGPKETRDRPSFLARYDPPLEGPKSSFPSSSLPLRGEDRDRE